MDDVIYESKLHYIIFCWPVSLMVIGCALLFSWTTLKPLAVLLLGVGALAGIMFYAAFVFSIFQIRQKSILIQTGVWARQTIHLPLSKIETISVHQTILGALLNYGTVILIGTGGTKNYFQHIANPLTCRRHLEKLLNDQ